MAKKKRVNSRKPSNVSTNQPPVSHSTEGNSDLAAGQDRSESSSINTNENELRGLVPNESDAALTGIEFDSSHSVGNQGERLARNERLRHSSGIHFRDLFAKSNRGLLLDLFVFLLNLFLMHFLTGGFVELFRQASADDGLAKFAIALTCLAMWLLPPTGAVLKRWHFHQRLKSEGKSSAAKENALAGCLFNPIFYFCLNLVLECAVMAGLGDQLFGKALTKNGALFISLTFIGLFLTIVQTYLIYRYFSAPKRPPKWPFLRSPQSELLGDVCIFLNMILFQVAWNLLTLVPLERVSGVGDFLGRLFFLSFIALLIYFPPRMFYLAEDINRRRTWLTMLLANSPVIFRILIGSNQLPDWG